MKKKLFRVMVLEHVGDPNKDTVIVTQPVIVAAESRQQALFFGADGFTGFDPNTMSVNVEEFTINPVA